MKRLIIACLWGMVFIILGFAQIQEGRGTWYETDSKGLSASHSNLPFGTRVRITNLQNERQVIVTIDNRIPDTPNRIIDIARAAADNLEMNPRGTTPVRIEVIARRQSDIPVIAAEASPPPVSPTPNPPVIPTSSPTMILPIVEVPSETPAAQTRPGMVNQTIITFNGMPNYTQTQGSVSLTPAPSITSPGGSQVTILGGEPMLTAQEVPVPVPVPARPEPILQTPEPVIASPAPAVSSPQPMIVQPVVVAPVVVPPVITPPILAEPVLTPPVLAEPVLTPPILAEPVLTPPVVAEPVMTPPIVAGPVTTSPLTVEPVTSSPITVPMVNSEPVFTPPLNSDPTIPTIPIISGPPTISPEPQNPQVSIPRQIVEPQKFVQVLPRMPDLGNGKVYRLQVGAFSNEINAREAVFRLREVGFDPAYEFYGGYCRVVITGIRAPDMEIVISRIGTAGFGQVFIREEL